MTIHTMHVTDTEPVKHNSHQKIVNCIFARTAKTSKSQVCQILQNVSGVPKHHLWTGAGL